MPHTLRWKRGDPGEYVADRGPGKPIYFVRRGRVYPWIVVRDYHVLGNTPTLAAGKIFAEQLAADEG